MYQVIARKYRPQTFGEVVNQDHVKQTLTNALDQNRVAHGYIFSGLRGSGKTTMARILAKALNCPQRQETEPCGECPSCVDITAGNSLDLVEIDAASNRRIDDIRELRENVRYRPVRDRYKIFIIDEAHQITADAFNALLKTLEEPPEWVVFILCTTEPQDIPATIASRCQGFSFRTVEFEKVVARMRWICEQEGIEADDDALSSIAQAGDGSIRDSLSTLDQAIACFGNKLDSRLVRDLLGAIPTEITDRVMRALQESDARAMMEIVDQLVSEGRNLQHFTSQLTGYFRNLLILKIVGPDTSLVPVGNEQKQHNHKSSEKFSQEDLTRYLQILLDLFRDLQKAPQPRFLLEVGLLKLVHAGRLAPIEAVLAAMGGSGASGGKLSGGPRSTSTPQVPGPSASPAMTPVTASLPSGTVDTAAPPPSKVGIQGQLVSKLRDQGQDFAATALQHALVEQQGKVLLVRPAASDAATLQFTQKQLEACAKEIDPGLRLKLGEPSEGDPNGSAPVAATSVEPASDNETIERALHDPEVQRFKQLFEGRVREARDLRS